MVGIRGRLLAVVSAVLLHVCALAGGEHLPELPQPRSEPAPAPRPPLDWSRSGSELEMAAGLLLRFYQVFLSSQDGPRCQFTPSCSEYARIVVRRHGLLAGLLMASDRYQRCNGLDRERYPLDPRTGKRLDPPPERPPRTAQR
jgi:putative component of membrane protein insertase Oxa1/YidC/SpoIIIJ protein YidD